MIIPLEKRFINIALYRNELGRFGDTGLLILFPARYL